MDASESPPGTEHKTAPEIPESDEQMPEIAGPEVPVGASSQIEVPPRLIDQVIGQEHAVDVIRKAATQRRHVMMIGSPGTGKSMLGKAMAELLPKEELQDILVYPNSDDPNNPVIRTVAVGRGKQIVAAHKAEAKRKIQFRNTMLMLLIIGIVGYAFITYQWLMGIIAAAFLFMARIQRQYEHGAVHRRDRFPCRGTAR
jgi:Lon-like ATP-dependent protease